MADQPKKKSPSAVKRNDSRSNGKASKQTKAGLGPRQTFRGSHNRPARLTELQKALLGGGAMRRITRRLPEDTVKTPVA